MSTVKRLAVVPCSPHDRNSSLIRNFEPTCVHAHLGTASFPHSHVSFIRYQLTTEFSKSPASNPSRNLPGRKTIHGLGINLALQPRTFTLIRVGRTKDLPNTVLQSRVLR